MEKFRILAINPGSTSTKISIFHGEEEVFTENIVHDYEELKKFKNVIEQEGYRYEAILNALAARGYSLDEIDVVVARGGILRPVKAGTYRINDLMLEDLKDAVAGEHASNVAAFIAHRIGAEKGIPAYIVDPVSVDEMEDVARISGLDGIERKSLSHALNIRRVIYKVSEKFGKDPGELNFIVAHLGGGISIGAIRRGQMVDVESANCEGPFSPERSGGLPILELIDLCFSGRFTKDELKRRLIQEGGVYSYLGTKDIREVEERTRSGDKKAALILEAMVYQIAKCIGQMATVLKGDVDFIILTGGIAKSDYISECIADRVKFIAPVERVPGEEEMKALAEAACRVMTGREKVLDYGGGE
ncbi:butyrate kinase [Thermosediminibacter oceani]|uniref:Probable butyrate kinase n=1 Tax=Thermosediminibacter oceani (strain ATCC BAA-1034 / DSM 16646 / JW/IW-1228P) TaxID=555079 RepID=D9RY84_THEOJ|nr:butyrate kinase [Thermosediminibacter oceani]ADL08308.1 butyrate kinase [Thermosediminibacter oceani DSM 16646]